MADDAAARFYRASHATNAARGDGYALQSIGAPSHRYYGASRVIEDHKPKAVLELGYGGPGLANAVAALGEFEYHLTDILDRTEGAGLPAHVKVHVCNLDNQFPFEDEAFDVVLALMVVEHLYDPFHSMREIARVLRPGGRLVLNLPNIASIACRLQLLRGKMPVTSSSDWFDKREWDGGHLHYFTVELVERLCALYGLRLVQTLPVGRHLWLKRLNPALLCHEITYILEKTAA